MSPAKVGLTGGIGSGKSAAAAVFKSLGIRTIDADQVARELTQPGTEQFNQIVSYFGQGIIDAAGNIDRPGLGKLIFSDSEKRLFLESILHTPIKETIYQRIENWGDSYCILEIPLLIETGQYREMDRVIVVTCQYQKKIERLQFNRGMELDTIEKVLSNQMTDQEKLEHADEVINNDGTLSDLKKQIVTIHERLAAFYSN